MSARKEAVTAPRAPRVADEPSPATERRIKVAVQKAGRLTDHSLELLQRAGLVFTRGRDQLLCYGENLPVDILLVRDDDIPDLIRDGVCDLGILGANVVREDAESARTSGRDPAMWSCLDLDFGRCRLMLAVPEDFDYAGPASLRGLRIATGYPGLLRRFLSERGVDAQITTLSGSVELAPRLGKADAICDLVSSGATLAANHLRPVDVVLESSAVLVRAPRVPEGATGELLERLLGRIQGVQRVQGSKYVMLHAPRDSLDRIRRLLPGAEAPTILPLDGCGDRVAVHAVCRETVFWETLEDLKAAGASAMLVLPVEKMLA